MTGNATAARIFAVIMLFAGVGCATDPDVNRASQSASQYWSEKAPSGELGKTINVQVLEATRIEDGKIRVRALVDGQQRIGHFNAASGTFDEGYYSLSIERGKKINELEQENHQLKEQLIKAKAKQND